jgi:ParB family transcriptional regulator, chromosome partitioning protein
MTKPRGGLGRGLEALIPGGSATSFEHVPIESIAPAPGQPRQSIDPEALAELAASITEHGVLQPLIVSRTPDSAAAESSAALYILVAGERRWQAAKLAGLAQVPVVIKNVTPQKRLELALVENIQRADLSPLEEAQAYQQLAVEFGLTQEEVAARVGKSRTTIANSLRLLNLSPQVKASLAERKISEGHARALLGLRDQADQETLLRLILQKGLNVRQVEQAVRHRQAPKRPRPSVVASAESRALEERFREALGTKVELLRGRKGGKLVVHFYSDEELQGLYDLIVKE